MHSAQRLRWLIASTTDGKTEVLSLEDGGRRILPVFSFREEAEMYARLQLATPRWRPRMYSAGEIVSLLYGPLEDVASVALDPLPEVCDRASLYLVSVGRRPFVGSLVREGRQEASRRRYEATSRIPSCEPLYATTPSRVAARETATDPASAWPGARG
jgi:hypothetical protein